MRRGLSWPRRGAARADTLAQAEAALTAQAWQRMHRASRRWALWGALTGALLALVLFAPAAWLAQALASATDRRVLLVQPRGTVWNGSAALVISAGPDSQDAALLPGRLQWALRPAGLQASLQLRQDCCMERPVQLHLQPGWGRLRATLEPPPGGRLGQWPAAWLSGLGTPWNTLQLGGLLSVGSTGLQIDWAQGRLALEGRAQVELLGMSSRLSTLQPLGSYQLVVQGRGTSQATTLELSTLEGALQLSGQGMWAGSRLRFTGEARAAEGSEAALNNLLNIIGLRQGARAIIKIG